MALKQVPVLPVVTRLIGEAVEGEEGPYAAELFLESNLSVVQTSCCSA